MAVVVRGRRGDGSCSSVLGVVVVVVVVMGWLQATVLGVVVITVRC